MSLSRSSTAAATTCVLLVGNRVVLRADAPPEAEYLLFEVADIELRGRGPGRVREHGYLTTAKRARQRLDQIGITAAFARECSLAMHPVLSTAYARGPAVRQIAGHLESLQLFQADTFDGTSQVYRGVFLDLSTLVTDLDLPGGAAMLQALFLAALLEGEHDETTVFLSTEACTTHRKLGERTYRRPKLAALHELRTALADLADLAPRPDVREHLARTDVVAFVRARGVSASNEDARAIHVSLERSIAGREAPTRGPLAEPELWAIETRLETGNFENILEVIEEVERRRGRTPGTTYLRARASLTLHLEPAKLIAERASALALSMTSFQEVYLLAAEAWLDAGDSRRAIPYARDLIDALGIDEALLLRAKRLLARAIGTGPERINTYADRIPSFPMPAHSPPSAATTSPVSVPTREGELPPSRRVEASFAIDLVQTQGQRPARPTPPASRGPHHDSDRASHQPPERRGGGATVETRAPPTYDPRAEPDSMETAAARTSTARSYRNPRGEVASMDMSREPAKLSTQADPPPPASVDVGRTMGPGRDTRRGRNPSPPLALALHGATLPPYRLERPAPLLPDATGLPKFGGVNDLAEHLGLPAGFDNDPHTFEHAVPRSVLEARVTFTLLARELGSDYRLKRGIELRADVSGIEAMQSVLLDTFPEHVIRTSEDAYELRRHGALLSEILARRLEAQWVDISPNELGYWAMIVPQSTRVWPFGRVARLIEMAHKERDLVSFFLEVESRARRR